MTPEYKYTLFDESKMRKETKEKSMHLLRSIIVTLMKIDIPFFCAHVVHVKVNVDMCDALAFFFL